MRPKSARSAPSPASLDKIRLHRSSSCRPTFLCENDDASRSSQREPMLQDWLYWQRDPRHQPGCWTKVFAVLEDSFLWLFQRQESMKHSLLVQLAVTSVQDADGRSRQLCVRDPNGEELAICLCDDEALKSWKAGLEAAADATHAFFRASAVDVHDLPAWSNYRGTLISYHRVSTRARCRRALHKVARCWKRHLVARTSGS